jgi:hypothetical protein
LSPLAATVALLAGCGGSSVSKASECRKADLHIQNATASNRFVRPENTWSVETRFAIRCGSKLVTGDFTVVWPFGSSTSGSLAADGHGRAQTTYPVRQTKQKLMISVNGVDGTASTTVVIH